jgi:fructokinase
MITRCGRHSTLAFVKLEHEKEPQYVFYREGSADCSFSPEDLPACLPPETNCVLFGSISMTMEPIASAIETLIFREASRKDGKKPVISFDPNIRPFLIADRAAYIKRFEKWIAASAIVKISAADFDFIYPDLAPDEALQKILAMGPALVIGTMGSEGAAALLRRGDNGLVRAGARAIPVPVADTIGAGDAFHGAFLSWLEIRGKMSHNAIANLGESELREALFFANKAAAIVCSRRGADPPALREMENFAL